MLTAQDVLLDFRLMQYNALSLKGAGALELFAAGLRRSRVDIAGVQETRLRHDGLSTQGDFWVLSAPASPKGVGGAQVWVRKQAAWDAKAFSVVHKEAQLLVVLGSFQGVRLLLVSAHAPPTDSPEADLQAWWQHLCTVLHRTPASCVPIIFVDANATFQRDPTDPGTAMATPTCRNARHLRHFAESRGLGLTPQAFPTGEPLVSWISPSGKRKLIDYMQIGLIRPGCCPPRTWGICTPTLITVRSPYSYRRGLLPCQRSDDVLWTRASCRARVLRQLSPAPLCHALLCRGASMAPAMLISCNLGFSLDFMSLAQRLPPGRAIRRLRRLPST